MSSWQRRQIKAQRGQQHIASSDVTRQGVIRAQFRSFVERGVEIGQINPALAVVGAEACRRLIAMVAGSRFRRRQSIAEVKLLEAVQGVVMHEILDRGLRRQHLLQTMQQVMQPADVVVFVCAHEVKPPA
jgi:predicted RNase H-like nuclease